jgi:hypothetical protein
MATSGALSNRRKESEHVESLGCFQIPSTTLNRCTLNADSVTFCSVRIGSVVVEEEESGGAGFI